MLEEIRVAAPLVYSVGRDPEIFEVETPAVTKRLKIRCVSESFESEATLPDSPASPTRLWGMSAKTVRCGKIDNRLE